MSSFTFHFWGIFSLEIKFYVNRVLYAFYCFKDHPTAFWPPIFFLIRKEISSVLLALCIMCLFSLDAFKNFPFSLDFSGLAIDTQCDFLSIYPEWVCWTAWIYKLMDFIKFDNFWSLFLQIVFPCSSLSLLLGLQ